MSDSPKCQDAAPIRVLVVEDDPSDAQWLRALLEASREAAFEVAEAGGVEDGLRRLRDERFHAVLLDLSLEEGQGLAALARARIAAATVPIIAMASQRDENLAIRALRFGAQDYLVKHVSEEQAIVRTLRTLSLPPTNSDALVLPASCVGPERRVFPAISTLASGVIVPMPTLPPT